MHTIDERTQELKLCSRCILPDTFPGVMIDADGICNFCRKSEGADTVHSDAQKNYAQKFLHLIQEINHPSAYRSRSYDILMAYSGGKDSTYTMALLKRQYGLRVLALSFDNGFTSETAVANIRRVTDALGIDHIFFKPGWEILKKIFSAAAEQELYSKKSLERASTICTTCIGLVKSICLKTAIEQNIPLVGFGWSPGQAPVASSIMKNNPALVKMAQDTIRVPLREVAGAAIEPYFLAEQHYALSERFPHNVHPMAWEYYNEAMIIDEISRLGWQLPPDTDTNSSNCLLNAYANQVHIGKYGFHPYVWEIANMVRQGVMSREEGYHKIYAGQSPELASIARKRLVADSVPL